MTTQPLVIKDWQNGMAPSPNLGIGLIRNASVDAQTGALSPNYVPATLVPTASSDTFTVNTGTDIGTVTTSFAAMTTNVAVVFSTTTTLPAPLVAGTIYFLIRVTATTFKVATTLANSIAGTAIDLTTTGTGTHTMTTVNIGTVRSIASVSVPNVLVTDGSGNSAQARLVFYYDSNSRVWFRDPNLAGAQNQLVLLPGNTLTSGHGRGLAVFVNLNSSIFLFAFRDSAIDVCNVTSDAKRTDPIGTSSWTNGWQTLNASGNYSHHAIVGDDNIIYWGDGRYVGSLQEVAGSAFAPGTPATYTFNDKALTLPQAEVAEHLEQLGVNLLVAGSTYNRIYPWDRSSPSFGLPIYCAERGVWRLKNIENTIFILNGQRGNIYKTQGAIVTRVGTLPQYVIGSENSSSSVYNTLWGGIGAKSGNLIFGAYATNNTTNSGIYMLYPDGRLILDNQPSGGAAQVFAFDDIGDEFYTFGTAAGVDLVGSTRYGSFGTVVQSALYEVADKMTKGKYSEVEVQLNKPTTGSSSQIRVSYRRSLSGSFTTLATFTTDGSSTSFSSDIGIIDIENIQVQVELTGTGSNSDALELLEVRLIP